MDSWRLAMSTVAAARPTYCSVLAWDQAWTVANAASYTVDGIHPNDRGFAMINQVTLGGSPAIGTYASVQNGEPWPVSPLAIAPHLTWWDATPNSRR